MAKKANEVYALYKGDNWICDGTLEEIAEYTEKELKRLKYLSCPIEFAGVRGAVCDDCGKWL